ncbi:hypothetical protein HYX14_02245 [Candidatus Woesearchaeota archaeon]|nr:hypothetical protein [Candidatus Woesearchaeota archaeon]
MVKTLYLCEHCNFLYSDKKAAEQCEKFCDEHHSCSIIITKKSIGRLEQ